MFWNGEAWTRRGAGATRMRPRRQLAPQPEVHLRADSAVAYQHVAEVMSDAAKSGSTRIGFVSDPDVAN